MKAFFQTSFFVVLSLFAIPACEEYGESIEVSAEGSVWEDPATGLMWQQEAPEEFFSWEAAMDYCDTVNLDGYDDWRVPTISELRTIIVGCQGTATSGMCFITDECSSVDCSSSQCYGCEYEEIPSDACYSVSALSRPCEHYWSSTSVAGHYDRAWAVGFSSGFIYKPRKVYNFHVRCVRDE